MDGMPKLMQRGKKKKTGRKKRVKLSSVQFGELISQVNLLSSWFPLLVADFNAFIT